MTFQFKKKENENNMPMEGDDDDSDMVVLHSHSSPRCWIADSMLSVFVIVKKKCPDAKITAKELF